MQNLAPLTLSATTDIEPVKLANFRNQRAQLDIRVENIDEYFRISKITVFVKESASGYPQ